MFIIIEFAVKKRKSHISHPQVPYYEFRSIDNLGLAAGKEILFN